MNVSELIILGMLSTEMLLPSVPSIDFKIAFVSLGNLSAYPSGVLVIDNSIASNVDEFVAMVRGMTGGVVDCMILQEETFNYYNNQYLAFRVDFDSAAKEDDLAKFEANLKKQLQKA